MPRTWAIRLYQLWKAADFRLEQGEGCPRHIDGCANTVSVIAAATNTVVKTVTVGKQPEVHLSYPGRNDGEERDDDFKAHHVRHGPGARERLRQNRRRKDWSSEYKCD
jgi:YVTN family beta-propeller protein